ncbi:MAG: DUF167 domain-containing protein [Candidatus Marinimicrobia bacterium]|nr:DUF167 domain-containing protein [Candidatus Neomarinimicrobiota bacterium]
MANITRLKIKVAPGAKQNRIIGWHGDVLKVRISAQPEKGKANSGVRKLIAEALGVPTRSVSVTVGLTSKNKHVVISGLSGSEVKSKIDDNAADHKKGR